MSGDNVDYYQMVSKAAAKPMISAIKLEIKPLKFDLVL